MSFKFEVRSGCPRNGVSVCGDQSHRAQWGHWLGGHSVRETEEVSWSLRTMQRWRGVMVLVVQDNKSVREPWGAQKCKYYFKNVFPFQFNSISIC